MNIPTNRRFLLIFGKALVLALTFYFLYTTIFAAPDTLATWQSIVSTAWSSNKLHLLVLTALLIPLNWGFEAAKWYLLGNRIEKMSFLRAYRAVMVGLTLGFITPNRIGDYAGRVLELKSKERLDAIGAIFIGRFCQLVATVLVGSFGLLYFLFQFYALDYPAISLSLVVVLVVLNISLMLLLYNARAMVAMVAAISPLKKFVHYVAVMANYTPREMTQLLWLSLGRYFIFLFQFVLLLVFFDVKLTILEYFSGVSGTFFLKSVVPSVTLLSDLGVRELSAMYLFGLLGQDRLFVLSASLTLWLLNIAVPSAIGVFFVLKLRLSKKGVAT